jgi:GT2 family glycosyltransferase
VREKKWQNRDVRSPWPTVTVIYLSYNRSEELRRSLRQTLEELDYPSDRLDVIVVDNASTDGSADMVEREFPAVQLIRRTENNGVPGWNDGFAVARGDFVLVLDDDCYLPGDGLQRAVVEATARHADLVSFGVSSSLDDGHRFDHEYRTGLLSFWGCAALMRREVVERLGGYDPAIFVWANELEFTIRFFDAGFRHLHLPNVIAVHMKEPAPWKGTVPEYVYCTNACHFAYIAGKLLRPRDAAETFLALLATSVRDARQYDRVTFKALPFVGRGFMRGLRNRAPVRPSVSRAYRLNYRSFASPWWLSRPPAQILMSAMTRANGDGNGNGKPPGRHAQYFSERAMYYPDRPAVLQL